jgi:putative ABC transport system permease protein
MVLNIMYSGEREVVEPQFLAAIAAAYPERETAETITDIWPYQIEVTALQMISQNAGLTVMIAYLAIYIGFILLIACAAILALQQLSEAADNIPRYQTLEELGADRKTCSRAVLTQIAIYFVFPLVVALCHSLVALNVLVDIVVLFGYLDIAMPLVITVSVFLALYAAYFLITYFGSRAMLRQRV